MAGAVIANNRNRNQEQAYEQGAADAQQPAPAAPPPPPPPAAPPPPDPADQIEHYAQLHESGALTDEEFAAVKAKILGL